MTSTKAHDFAFAHAHGYRVHHGTADGGGLAGLYWWTRMRPGWCEPEVSEGQWATQAEAEQAAARACAFEALAGELA